MSWGAGVLGNRVCCHVKLDEKEKETCESGRQKGGWHFFLLFLLLPFFFSFCVLEAYGIHVFFWFVFSIGTTTG